MSVSVSMELIPESGLREAIGMLVGLVETAGALIIFIGAVWAFARFAAALLRDRGQPGGFNRIRLTRRWTGGCSRRAYCAATGAAVTSRPRTAARSAPGTARRTPSLTVGWVQGGTGRSGGVAPTGSPARWSTTPVEGWSRVTGTPRWAASSRFRRPLPCAAGTVRLG